MPISIQCPACGAALNVPNELMGQAVRCPHCQTAFTGSATPQRFPPAPAAASNLPIVILVIVCGGAFMLALLCVVSLAAIQFLGEQASTTFSTIGTIEDMPRQPFPPPPNPMPKAVSRPLTITAYGTLRGKASYVGPPPPASPAWQIGKGQGVANVAVWVRPTEGTHFPPIPADRKTWKREVSVELRGKEFAPRVALVFPGLRDGNRQLAPSGQVFRFANVSPIAQNVNYSGDFRLGIAGNFNLAPRDIRPVELPPDQNTVINLRSGRFPAMQGYIWSLDTPYAAVTDAAGNFVIDPVPAGVDLELVAWHEEGGFLDPGGSLGQPIRLQAGANVRNLALTMK